MKQDLSYKLLELRLSCCDETDSKDLETSHPDRNPQSQNLVAYDKPVSFQVWSVLFYSLSWSDVGVQWSDVGVHEYDRLASVSRQ